MSRFQAQLNAVLGEELDDLRNRLGLRRNQRADLLREIAVLASWVVRQAEAGRSIEARRGRDRLANVLDRGFSPTPALRKALSQLAKAKLKPPKVRWKGGAA